MPALVCFLIQLFSHSPHPYVASMPRTIVHAIYFVLHEVVFRAFPQFMARGLKSMASWNAVCVRLLVSWSIAAFHSDKHGVRSEQIQEAHFLTVEDCEVSDFI